MGRMEIYMARAGPGAATTAALCFRSRRNRFNQAFARFGNWLSRSISAMAILQQRRLSARRRIGFILWNRSCFAERSFDLRPRQVPDYTNAKQSSHSRVSEINYNARFMHFPWKEEQPIDANSNNCPAGPVSHFEERDAQSRRDREVQDR